MQSAFFWCCKAVTVVKGETDSFLKGLGRVDFFVNVRIARIIQHRLRVCVCVCVRACVCMQIYAWMVMNSRDVLRYVFMTDTCMYYTSVATHVFVSVRHAQNIQTHVRLQRQTCPGKDAVILLQRVREDSVVCMHTRRSNRHKLAQKLTLAQKNMCSHIP